MKKKFKILTSFMVLFLLIIPFQSAYAYSGGLANGKEVVIDSVMLGGPTTEITRTNSITDNDELTYYELMPKQYVVIDLGKPANIVGMKFKAEGEFSDLRIASFTEKKQTQGAFFPENLYPNGFDGSFQAININNAQYMVLWYAGTGPMNIYELDFFSEVPTDTTEPTDPIEPTEPTEPQPNSNRAILAITLITGLEKEYDLPMSDVTAFLSWYDSRDAGSGPAKFAINKYTNNKGPFTNRTDYVIFDKILHIEVNEYSI